jgi:hypothetical protein
MSRFVRSIQSYQQNFPIPVPSDIFLLGKKRITPIISCPIYTSPNEPKQEPALEPEPSILYHKNPKYGASKYTSSLQVGKMHKILANQ